MFVGSSSIEIQKDFFFCNQRLSYERSCNQGPQTLFFSLLLVITLFTQILFYENCSTKIKFHEKKKFFPFFVICFVQRKRKWQWKTYLAKFLLIVKAIFPKCPPRSYSWGQHKLMSWPLATNTCFCLTRLKGLFQIFESKIKARRHQFLLSECKENNKIKNRINRSW